MSDKPSDDAGTGGAFQAAKDAVASAAEQVRASAPGAYDASAKAARYVGEATADHPLPVLLVTAALAFLPTTPATLEEKTIDGAGEIRQLIGRSGVMNWVSVHEQRRRPFRKVPPTRVNTLHKMSANTQYQER